MSYFWYFLKIIIVILIMLLVYAIYRLIKFLRRIWRKYPQVIFYYIMVIKLEIIFKQWHRPSLYFYILTIIIFFDLLLLGTLGYASCHQMFVTMFFFTH